MNRNFWVLAFGCCLASLGCVGDPPQKPDTEVYQTETPDFTPVPNEGREIEVSEAYATFRSQALENASPDLKEETEGDAVAEETNSSSDAADDGTESPTIQGIIIESGLPDRLVAVYAKSDGTVSRHDSEEEESETAPDREEVKDYIKQFVAEWYEPLPEFEPVTSFPYPQESVVRFFAITDQGVFMTAAFHKDVDHERHPLFRPHAATMRLVDLLNSESE